MTMRSAAPAALLACVLAATAAHAVTFTVTTTADDGAGSLRQAIVDANADTDPDVIAFAIGVDPPAIALTSALPTITNPVTIDGTTQSGFAGAPLVEIDGASVPAPASGLVITASNSTVRGLVIERFAANGVTGGVAIELLGGTGNTIEGNYLGLDVGGTLNHGNARYGVLCDGCDTA